MTKVIYADLADTNTGLIFHEYVGNKPEMKPLPEPFLPPEGSMARSILDVNRKLRAEAAFNLAKAAEAPGTPGSCPNSE